LGLVVIAIRQRCVIILVDEHPAVNLLSAGLASLAINSPSKLLQYNVSHDIERNPSREKLKEDS
jgi:hypothetical protein